MRIGALRHLVALQQRVDTIDGNGDTVTSWQPFAQVYAEIAPLSAREFVAAQSLQSSVSCRITIRYLAGVTATMRVVHGSTVYNIAGVLADAGSGREYLTLACSEGVNDG